jgi:hypothetical protein
MSVKTITFTTSRGRAPHDNPSNDSLAAITVSNDSIDRVSYAHMSLYMCPCCYCTDQ